MNKEDICLVKTCADCPEQYDAYDRRGRKVGYLRLRNGYFTVSCPDIGGHVVFSDSLPGSDGGFDSREREIYLNAAKKAIAEYVTAIGSAGSTSKNIDDV